MTEAIICPALVTSDREEAAPGGHVVTHNIPRPALPFLDYTNLVPRSCWCDNNVRRHIESSFDYHEHYARVSPQWLRLQTMWSVTRLSQHLHNNNSNMYNYLDQSI